MCRIIFAPWYLRIYSVKRCSDSFVHLHFGVIRIIELFYYVSIKKKLLFKTRYILYNDKFKGKIIFNIFSPSTSECAVRFETLCTYVVILSTDLGGSWISLAILSDASYRWERRSTNLDRDDLLFRRSGLSLSRLCHWRIYRGPVR